MSKSHQNVNTDNHQTQKTAKSKTATSMSKTHQNVNTNRYIKLKTSTPKVINLKKHQNGKQQHQCRKHIKTDNHQSHKNINTKSH